MAVSRAPCIVMEVRCKLLQVCVCVYVNQGYPVTKEEISGANVFSIFRHFLVMNFDECGSCFTA